MPPDASSEMLPAYERTGSGPPLLLIHGLGGERRTWDPVTARLEGDREVIAVDLPGFGASPVLPEGVVPTPAALAAELAHLLDALGLDRVDVGGNSLGGWVALELALQGRARTVCGIAPAGLWARPLAPKPYVAREIARRLDPALSTLLRSPRVRDGVLAGSVGHPERVPYADAVRMVRSYGAAPGYVAASNAMRAGRFEGAADLDVPVTLAWCALDRLITRPKRLEVVAHEVTLADCGHVPMWDDPQAVAGVLRAASGQETGTTPIGRRMR